MYDTQEDSRIIFRPMTRVNFFELAQGSLGIIWIPKKTSANQQPQVLGESWLAGLHVFLLAIGMYWSGPFALGPLPTTQRLLCLMDNLSWLEIVKKNVENISKALKWVKSCKSAIIYTISIPTECQKNCWLVVSTQKILVKLDHFPK